MTDNNKFIPKLPETRTEIVLNQEQQNQDKQKQTEKEQELKVLESYSEEIEASSSNIGTIPSYGPTDKLSEDDKDTKRAIEGGAGAGLAAASTIPTPVQPVANVIAGTEFIGGAAIEGAGKLTGSDELEVAGNTAKTIGEIGSLPGQAKNLASGKGAEVAGEAAKKATGN